MSRSKALCVGLPFSVAAPGLLMALLTFMTASTAVALSTQDCKNVGGTVVTVTDDRCGATKQYCRMPDTNAVCIDKLSLSPGGTVRPGTKVIPGVRAPSGVMQRAP